MPRLNTDPDGRRLARAAGLTGVIYGLICLFLFLTPYRTVLIASCGSSDLAGSPYRSVHLSLAGTASAGPATGIPVLAGGPDISLQAVSPTTAGKVLSPDRPNGAKSSSGPADIVTARALTAGLVRASVHTPPAESAASGLPVADPAMTEFHADSSPGTAESAGLSRPAETSTLEGNAPIAGSPPTSVLSLSGMDGSGAGDVSPSASGTSPGTAGSSTGNVGGYTFSGNGFLPDGVRGSGRFSSWIDGAIRKRLVYPERARRRNLQGSVILALSVPADGSRCEASVLESSGSAILDDAALSLLKSLFPAPVLPEKEFYSPIKIQYLIVQD